ncbi:hypothetical protein QVD17_41533 [Tagetes erecta]|uniref:Uncharacterized protein n=1 Tax=Tagetes erecta TaxID=13708 RepID=A0AAD8JMW2_TARER|nr:hypothetical protein QVD17_41533 [Tagetes erecta]
MLISCSWPRCIDYSSLMDYEKISKRPPQIRDSNLQEHYASVRNSKFTAADQQQAADLKDNDVLLMIDVQLINNVDDYECKKA